MYKRKSNSGHEIEWNPDDEKAAAKALVAVEGTEVTAEAQVKDESIDFGDDHELAQQVQEQYQKLTGQKEGSE